MYESLGAVMTLKVLLVRYKWNYQSRINHYLIFNFTLSYKSGNAFYSCTLLSNSVGDGVYVWYILKPRYHLVLTKKLFLTLIFLKNHFWEASWQFWKHLYVWYLRKLILKSLIFFIWIICFLVRQQLPNFDNDFLSNYSFFCADIFSECY